MPHPNLGPCRRGPTLPEAFKLVAAWKFRRLKYHDSIADAVADLGKPDEIGKVFTGFQKYLYQDTA
jgi:hypothetical protein